MAATKSKLLEAEGIAIQLFNAIEERGLIEPGKSEKQLNTEIFGLANELFGIEKYWHKRIVRSGANTLSPYDENPPDLVIQDDDILFFDFGPIIEDWEADLGRTYVISNDPAKHKIKNDIEAAWYEARDWFFERTTLTGAEFYKYVVGLAHKYGWSYGSHIGGHLIGEFPHERLDPGNYSLYVHAENPNDMFLPDKNGNKREWILELQFIDPEKKVGSFFEQLLT